MLIDRYEIHRWFLWIPVALAIGIWQYFSLPFEPPAYAVFMIGLLGVSVFVFTIFRIKAKLNTSAQIEKLYSCFVWSIFLCQISIAFLLGFMCAKVRTLSIQTPLFPDTLHSITIDGLIESIEDVPRGTLKRERILRRIVLTDIKGLPFHVPSHLKIRVQGPYKKLINVSLFSRIQLIADLFPPPYPITTHGYDAPFDMFFKNISALGKLKDIQKVYYAPSQLHSSFIQKFNTQIQKLRSFLTQQIHLKIKNQYAAIASSLITGDKSGMSLSVRENFTQAGLSHMLAISGLHMGLLAGMIFFALSKFLVLIPGLALRFVIKKIAAIITIPIAFFYLFLSGCSFSALRSFIMVLLSMSAILINQHPISLRCTAIAALLILMLFPESLYSISFQLSFASVTGLCYFYESNRSIRLKNLQRKPYLGLTATKQHIYAFFLSFGIRLANPILQSMISTLIATLATMPIIIYSFQRLTLVGVIGNILAIPILSFWVLPAGVLAVFSLLKDGGISILFSLWEAGLKQLAWIAKTVAAMPGSNCTFAKPDLWIVVMITFSALWLIIWKTKKRWIGVPFLTAGILLFFSNQHAPNIFITQQGDIIGLADQNMQTFFISNLQHGSFHAKVWAQELGIKKIERMPYSQQTTIQCLIHPYCKNLYSDDVLLLTQTEKNTLIFHKKLSFHAKKRPWYLHSE